MDEKIKTWTLRFPAKENPNMERALFNWPIVLQFDVKAKYRLISRKFFGHEVFSPERSLNQRKVTRVCIRSMKQSNRSIYIRLLFLFCSRVFISRSYENHSIVLWSGFCSGSFQPFALRHLVIASSTTPRSPVFLWKITTLFKNWPHQVAPERLKTDFHEITISVTRDIPLLYSTGRLLWCGQ